MLEIARTKKQRPHKMCRCGPTIWCLLRNCQMTAMRWMVTEMMCHHLPPDSWFKRAETLCVKFRKLFNEDHRDEEDPFFDSWDGKQEEFDALQPLQQMDPWAQNAPKSVPDVKGCLLVNFPVCSVCQKLGSAPMFSIKAPQYDIFSERRRPTERQLQ